MSDIDPELPDYLVDAILSDGPPADAVDLVKNAFTWRTIDAELMELSYDSVLDEAGVRDASARRTMEFTAGEVSIVIEIDRETVEVRWSGTGVQQVALASVDKRLDSTGSLSVRFEAVAAGPWWVEIQFADHSFRTPAFTVG